jgi:hypothetical protein
MTSFDHDWELNANKNVMNDEIEGYLSVSRRARNENLSADRPSIIVTSAVSGFLNVVQLK